MSQVDPTGLAWIGAGGRGGRGNNLWRQCRLSGRIGGSHDGVTGLLRAPGGVELDELRCQLRAGEGGQRQQRNFLLVLVRRLQVRDELLHGLHFQGPGLVRLGLVVALALALVVVVGEPDAEPADDDCREEGGEGGQSVPEVLSLGGLVGHAVSSHRTKGASTNEATISGTKGGGREYFEYSAVPFWLASLAALFGCLLLIRNGAILPHPLTLLRDALDHCRAALRTRHGRRIAADCGLAGALPVTARMRAASWAPSISSIFRPSTNLHASAVNCPALTTKPPTAPRAAMTP